MVAVKIIPEVLEHLTFQSYQPQPTIAGVTHIPLDKHRALEGWFMEYLRLTKGAVEGLPITFEPRQFSLAEAVPGRINAFHLHPKGRQDELWCVIRGTLLVWLVDVRRDSPTTGAKRRVVLDGGLPTLLYIPSGIAHGYKAGPDGALLLYAMNAQFEAADPNEGRLPWDHFGPDLWEEDRG